MKLTGVELHPANSSDVAVMSFRDPRGENPYNVTGITGLGADEIVPKYYGGPGNTDGNFYNMSLMKRDVVIKIQLNPSFADNQSYSDLRDALYRMIASSRTGKIQLQFKNLTEVVAAISGFISKFETSLFEKTHEVQITIKCDEPMLKALNPTVVAVAGLNPANTTIQDAKSTAVHGFQFDLGITANIASLIATNSGDSSWQFEVIPVGGFLAGDVLHFSSEYNNKYLYLTRGATTIQLADVISAGSVWPILFPGSNVFALTHPTNVVWNAISYYPTYWGV